MPVTNVAHDIDSRTLTITAEFAAPPSRLWQVYADPVSSRRSGGRPPIPRPSSTTSSPPVAA